MTTFRNRVKELRVVKASDLVPHPDNWRNHPARQTEALTRVLSEIGFADVEKTFELEDGRLCLFDGHKRRELAGDEEIPVIVTDLTPDEARILLASFDPIGEMAQADRSRLEPLLRSLKGRSEEVDRVLQQVAAVNHLATFEPPVTQDELPDQKAEPRVEPGQLWRLGQHRLVCGSATEEADVTLATDGERCELTVTDPPYNVGYTGGMKPRDGLENDSLSPDEYRSFCRAFTSQIQRVTRGCVYVFGAPGPDGRICFGILDETLHWSATITWVKNSATFGRAKYRSRSEFIWFGWVENGERFTPDKHVENVWFYDRPPSSTEHSTMKPVDLMANAIHHGSHEADTVFDPFLGSGTTLIACEKSGRRCRGLEINPAYCDTIIARWEKLTGLKAAAVS